MAENQCRVRPAVPADAPGIARVHVDSWRETYTGLVPERYFSERAFERRKAWWLQNLSAESPAGPVWVAERDDRIVGFASAGPAIGPDAEKGYAPARALQLFTIYLLASEHGTGAGRALLEGVIGDQPAQLWVATANARARAFYERNGFHVDGGEYVDPDIDGLVEIRMVR